MSSIIRDEKITTTEVKARAIRPQIEKLITKAKLATLGGKKAVVSSLYNNKVLAKKLCDDIAPRYADRKGGYTRITKLLPRKSDGSKMAVIELV
jgi:large subunit ribosomal protein L17